MGVSRHEQGHFIAERTGESSVRPRDPAGSPVLFDPVYDSVSGYTEAGEVLVVSAKVAEPR